MDLNTLKQKIKQIQPSNRNPLYQSHLYWSQKPFNVSRILIEELTNEGDVVFDPFMGSGVSIFESILLDRKSIGVEINELPIFIVETLLQKVGDNENFVKFIEEFLKYIEGLNEYYLTWSEPQKDYGIVKKVIFDRDSISKKPVLKKIHYKIQGDKHNYIKSPDKEDEEKFMKVDDLEFITDYKMLPNSRLAVRDNQKVSSLFAPRTLCIINKILEFESGLNDENYKNIIRYILMSSLHLIKITDLKSNSQWPLWTPKENCLEKNVVDVIKRRTRLFVKSYNFIKEKTNQDIQKATSYDQLIQNSDFLILNKGTQNLTDSDIPDNSVDLIITDPPYLGQVLYSEYMQLYYPFLNFDFNLRDEIVVSTAKSREKDEGNYFELLDQSFRKSIKKLKKGKIMCLYFHDSNLSVWNKLINITHKHGLYFLGQAHIYKKKTLKNILSPKKSLQGDSILFFVYENLGYKSKGVETVDEIVENIVSHVRFELEEKGSLTTTELMDEGLMEYIIQNNWLEELNAHYKSIIDVFEPYIKWNKYEAKWFLN